MNPSAALDRFYSVLRRLETSPQQGLKLNQYSGSSPLPKRGVYFFREAGEVRPASAESLRIVRVGTHAVSANSKATLWARLRTHLGTRAGNGNHRASIFRRHIGAALLSRDNAILPTWGQGSTAPLGLHQDPNALERERACEKAVSEYIGSMSVIWIAVPDEPSADSARAVIERNAIALLSNFLEPLDPPSEGWLGRCSPRPEIRCSGLWNLNNVDQRYDLHFLDLLEASAEQTMKQLNRSA